MVIFNFPSVGFGTRVNILVGEVLLIPVVVTLIHSVLMIQLFI